MDIRTKITVTLPDELITALEIDEDTAFITSYENGRLTIEPVDDEEFEEPDGDDLDELLGEEYQEDYEDGYNKGYIDASNQKSQRQNKCNSTNQKERTKYEDQ